MAEQIPAVESFMCDACGLCCRHLLVEADWSDVLREPRIAQQCPIQGAKAPLLEQQWDLTLGRGDCPFLGAGRECAIYATRPRCCVTFAAGSSKCQGLRADAGLPPLTAIAGQNLSDQINAAAIEDDSESQG